MAGRVHLLGDESQEPGSLRSSTAANLELFLHLELCFSIHQSWITLSNKSKQICMRTTTYPRWHPGGTETWDLHCTWWLIIRGLSLAMMPARSNLLAPRPSRRRLEVKPQVAPPFRGPSRLICGLSSSTSALWRLEGKVGESVMPGGYVICMGTRCGCGCCHGPG